MNQDWRPLPKDWKPYPKLWTSLSNAVGNLALTGSADPPGEALRLLCEGEWVATGTLKVHIWAGSPFSNLQSDTITVERWQALREAIARGLDDDPEGPAINGRHALPGLGDRRKFPNLATIEREFSWYFWQESCFATALLTSPGREEYFEAQGIEVAVASSLIESIENLARVDSPTTGPLSKGGRPPAADWEAGALAMAGRYYRGELKPATVADVVRALQEWASESGNDLADATAKPHAKRIFDAFRAWEAD